MIGRGDIFVVTTDTSTAQSVAAALGLNGRFSDVLLNDLQALARQLERVPAAAVIVDIDPQSQRTLSELETITRRFADSHFIVISNNLNSELVLEAMRAGARQFVLKPSIEKELGEVIDRLAGWNSKPSGGQGNVISVFSASGGCGATSLAVNLANEISLLSPDPTLLIDLDQTYGSVTSYLGLQGAYGIADVLSRRGRIDPQLINSTAVIHKENLHVLISPCSVNFSNPLPLEYARLSEALNVARRVYGSIVIDAPRLPLDTLTELAKASQQCLIVLQLTVKDVHVAKRMLATLIERHVEPERMLVVFNRYRGRHAMISLGEARQVIGSFDCVCVNNDFRHVMHSMDYGKPLSEDAPRSIARRDISRLADTLVKTRVSETASLAAH